MRVFVCAEDGIFRLADSPDAADVVKSQPARVFIFTDIIMLTDLQIKFISSAHAAVALD